MINYKKKITLQEVRNKCTEERFFSYEGFNDRIFSPISIYFVWLFVRLGWSGNSVSILSGLFAIIGGAMIANKNPIIVLIGSFGYLIYYMLDYVDGSVSRFNRKSGIGGQYIDWLMHSVSSLSYFTGLFAGAVMVSGYWIVPLGVLTIVAVSLSLGTYAFGWFSISMHYQQQRVKNLADKPIRIDYKPLKFSFFYRIFRYFSTRIFHENYLIFILPFLAILHLLYFYPYIDFRVVLIVLGGLIYFPVIFYKMWRLAEDGHIEHAYNKLFFDKNKPDLPNDHFFG